jgi:cellulose synthase/poly-beta-1,6-N-acetylglucosamine synthase-like glycosyltransferase
MSTALLLIGCVLLLLAAHPFTTYPASLRLLARWRPRPIAQGTPAGRIALCVCAYNEERVIRAKIENMLSLRASVGNLEILVYVDGSHDRTAEIVREYGEQVRLVASTERLGKTHGMNTLVRMADADYLVFSDANVEFAPDALPRLLAAFADPEVGCVCGHLIYTKPVGSATAATGSLYWRLEELIKTYESAVGSVMGADGSIFALRRSLHVPPPPDLIDDMYVSFAVLCDGNRIVRAADAYAYEESVHSSKEDFQRKIRIACQAFNVHRALWPQLRRMSWLNIYQYVSHKLLRWLTIFLLAGSAVFLLAGMALLLDVRKFIALLLVGGLCAAAIAVWPGGKLATLREAISAFVATGIGVLRSLRGDRFQTWNPPASARSPAAAGQTTAE